jgi:hypothetical protein
LVSLELFGGAVYSQVESVNEDENEATIFIDKIDVGMSGFVVHELNKEHSEIIKNAVVTSFDATTKTATLALSDYEELQSDALPNGKWKVKANDKVLLAFGYSRAMLIAPNEKIYYTIVKSVNTQWVHSDMFATILSLNGHPTPLQSDFTDMSKTFSVGIVFLYLQQKIYTLDALSFKILNISDAPLVQEKVKLPFYSRVDEIEANWFGEGSSEMQSYEPHYFELLVHNNKTNKELYKIVSTMNQPDLLEEFELGEEL